MLNTTRSTGAMAVAPHHLASQSALAVMRDGGNAIEAMIAAAATIAVVYPHMNGIGGDGFWLIVPPGGRARRHRRLRAGGAAAPRIDFYRAARHDETIPLRGPLAANTVAGTVGGWQAALTPGARAGRRAAAGAPAARRHRLRRATASPSRQPAGCDRGQAARAAPPARLRRHVSDRRRLARGRTACSSSRAWPPRLQALADDGLDGFYRGPLAARIGADLAAAGSPVTRRRPGRLPRQPGRRRCTSARPGRRCTT